jgi:hypothetical protein
MEIMTWAGIIAGVLAVVFLLGCIVGHMLKKLEFQRDTEEENNSCLEFEPEKKLMDYQLKIDGLQRGGTLITIDGSGLQPHLEEFMREILESIKVRRG